MDAVEEIKGRLSIEDVVSSYVDLKRSGSSLKGLCPFHQEKTPSFYVRPSHGTFHCFGCLEENELIWTTAGLRPIGEVQVGDCVLDSRGATRAVIAKQSKSGTLLGIQTGCFRGDALRVTPDHTCLVVRRGEAISTVRRVARDAVRGVKFYGRDGTYKDGRTARLEEVDAADIEVGDFFVFPVIPGTARRPIALAATDAIRPYTSGPRTARIHLLPANEEAAWLYGIWLAEGSIGRGFLRFSFSLTERETLAQRTVDVIRDQFGAESTIFERPETHLCEVISSKTDLAAQFKHWFGSGASGKRLPFEVLNWPEDYQAALLRGYLDGDGNQVGSHVNTVSQTLAYGIFALAIQCGFLPALTRKDGYLGTDGVTRKAAWGIGLRSQEGLSGFYEPIDGQQYYWSQVQQVHRLEGDHAVVDITVDGANTFVTKMAAVHNCGRGGDQFNFLMEIEHVDFPEALKRLAEQAGVTLPEREARTPSLKGRLHEINEAAQQFFAEALQSNEGRIARDYLQSRQFGDEAVSLFGLGYGPRGREMLVSHLHSKGFDDRTILAAGLALQEEIGGRLRDRFRGRLMFPIRDAAGKISGFGGRILGEGQPKYLNSPQTEIFDKSSVLFGIALAADSIRQTRRAVLVEGYLDAARAHLGGYLNTVASLGTAVTVQQLTTLARMADTVVLALDPDPAGQNAAARTAITALMEVTRARGRASGASGAVDLRIARLPEGHGDPDELIRDEPGLWEEAIAASKPAFDFFFDQTMESLDRSSPGWRQEAIDRLLPLIQQFSDSAGWQAEWIQRLAVETDTDPRALQRSIPAAAPNRRRRSPPLRGTDAAARVTSQVLANDPVVEIERGLVALLLQILVIPREAREALDGVTLERPEHQAILDVLLCWQNYEYELLREELPEDARQVADSLRARRTPLPPDGKTSLAVRLILARMEQARLQRQLRSAIETLKAMPADDQLAANENLGGLYQRIKETDGAVRDLEMLVLRGSP